MTEEFILIMIALAVTNGLLAFILDALCGIESKLEQKKEKP